jgi:2-polyprenyl-6-methoxyphenol hydroxylase-like FAD-dependent oxidoreductase
MEDQTGVERTQVVIIGAGPTGLSLAVQLLRYNVSFIIIEKNEATTPLSKAIVLQARTLEIFQEAGLAEEAIKRGRMTTAMNLFYKGNQKAWVEFSRLGIGLSPFPFALSLEQSKTEQLLVDFLEQHQKKIRWQSEFTRFDQDHKEVTVIYKDHTGKTSSIRAAYIVGCDGAGSPVRHQMDQSFEGSTEPKIFYVADVILTSPVINKDELFMFMISRGFVLFFPMEGQGHYRIVGILPDAKENDEEVKFEDIEASIKKQIVSPVNFEKLTWFSTYKVHSRKADAFQKGRCFIAGDAAHIHTPAGGQGMNTGIQDTYNLAWKLAMATRGQINEETLKTYDTERSENARHLLQTTDRMFDFMSGRNAFWNFIRLNFFSRIIGLISRNNVMRKRVFPLLSQTGITYSKNILTIESSIGNVKAGVRMPFFVFADGKQIFDLLTQPCFKLLFFTTNQMKSASLPDLKIRIISHTFTEIPAQIFGNERNFYILLRPDNHISYIGKEFKNCEELLKRIS